MPKCRVCGVKFVATRALQPTCGEYSCMVQYAESVAKKSAEKRKKEERAAFKERKEKAKRTQDLKAEAQSVVNRYVRLRDKDKPCISCGRPATWQGQWHASHFKSVGANSALRFNTFNIHKACSICNNHLSGNIGEYRIRLPERIGRERFEFIENHTRKRTFTRDYLLRIKSIFSKRCRILEKRNRHALQG